MDNCGSRCKQLEQLLTEYETRLELGKSDSECTEVHSFGPYNFHQEHNKFKGLLNGILARCKQCKSWGNSKQAVKAFVDRQQQIQLLQPLKSYIAECLDKLQSVIRENNLTDTIHHLELITRQVGLKFDVSTTYSECFISSDMFYVEVQLEDNGNIVEVKVAHAGESVPVTCPALTAILSLAKFPYVLHANVRRFSSAMRRDYTEFLNHMQGLANLYQLAGDAFQKSKIFQALVTLEKDLEKIAYSDGQKSFDDSVLRGPVGVLTPRQGGQLMRLTYFATPVELHGDNRPDLKESLDLQSLGTSKFGRSFSISVEQSTARLLPTSSLLSDDRYSMEQDFTEDKLGNIYRAINETNSEALPACFVLHLDRPLVVSAAILEIIHSTLENCKGESFVQNSKAFMDCLIIKEWLKERKMDYRSVMAYRQKLPDQEHIYRIAEKDIQGSQMQNDNIGVVISRIPFTHCRNVVEVIQLLRQQLVYNQLLTSVLSSEPVQEGLEEKDSLCFDVSTCSPFVVVVTFEEPVSSSLASVEFQVKCDCSIETRFKFSSRKTVFYDSGYVSRVVQRCLSVPVTMKYILKKAGNVHMDAGFGTAMAVDEGREVTKPSSLTPTAPFLPAQTSAVTLLASMIAGSDSPLLAPNSNTTLGQPSLSPSPTLPNILTTPSPTLSSFPFGSQDGQDSERPPATSGLKAPAVRQPEVSQAQPPPNQPPIRLRLKKVASSDKYVIETPKVSRQDSVQIVDNTSDVYSSLVDVTGLKGESAEPSQFQPSNNVEQFIQPTMSGEDQGMDFSAEPVSFSDVDNLGTALLVGSGSGNTAGTSRVPDVQGVFQTLPGGATGSPGGLDVEDQYGFDPGIDSSFDYEAEIDAANVASLASDSSAFDVGSDYDAGASTSSASAMAGSFDIDYTFDLDTILASGSQGDGSVGGGMSMNWGFGSDRGTGS